MSVYSNCKARDTVGFKMGETEALFVVFLQLGLRLEISTSP